MKNISIVVFAVLLASCNTCNNTISDPPNTQVIEKLFLFVDGHYLDEANNRASLKQTLISSYLDKRQVRPVVVEVYALDSKTIQGRNLSPEFKLSAEKAARINRGGWQTKEEVMENWNEAFSNFGSIQDGSTQIIESANKLNTRLTSLNEKDNVRILFITRWAEMSLDCEIKEEQFCMFDNNLEKGWLRPRINVLDSMIQYLNDSTSMTYQFANQLAQRLKKQQPPLSTLHYLQIAQAPVQDARTVVLKQNKFWDTFWGKAGLQRQEISSLENFFAGS